MVAITRRREVKQPAGRLQHLIDRLRRATSHQLKIQIAILCFYQLKNKLKASLVTSTYTLE